MRTQHAQVPMLNWYPSIFRRRTGGEQLSRFGDRLWNFFHWVPVPRLTHQQERWWASRIVKDSTPMILLLERIWIFTRDEFPSRSVLRRCNKPPTTKIYHSGPIHLFHSWSRWPRRAYSSLRLLGLNGWKLKNPLVELRHAHRTTRQPARTG